MKSEQSIFYVYVYLDPRKPGDYNYGEYHFDYEPFYVGKGSGQRMYEHLKYSNQKRNGNKSFKNKIKKIQKIFEPYIIKYKENLLEQDAYDLEGRMEETIGRKDLKLGPLCNLQKAGTGGSFGRILSEETKNKIGTSHRGTIKKYISERNKRCTGKNNPMYGKHHTKETKEKMSKIRIEKELSKTKNNPMYGKHHTKETRKRMSEIKLLKCMEENK